MVCVVRSKGKVVVNQSSPAAWLHSEHARNTHERRHIHAHKHTHTSSSNGSVSMVNVLV